MASFSNHLVAHRSPLRGDQIGHEACVRECGSEFGRDESQEWKNKCARPEAGRELEAGFSIRWCAPRRSGVRAAVEDGEVMANKRIPIACAQGQAPRSEMASRQVHRVQLRATGRLVVWAGVGFGQQHWAPTRPNLALEPTSYGRPPCPRGGPLRSFSTARPSRPAAAVGSALR